MLSLLIIDLLVSGASFAQKSLWIGLGLGFISDHTSLRQRVLYIRDWQK
jgi:hypothetical protein